MVVGTQGDSAAPPVHLRIVGGAELNADRVASIAVAHGTTFDRRGWRVERRNARDTAGGHSSVLSNEMEIHPRQGFSATQIQWRSIFLVGRPPVELRSQDIPRDLRF